MSVCKGMIRCLLIIFNLLFWFCGTAILALGIYVLADKNIKKKLQVFKFDTNDSYFKTLAYLLIGVGAFIFVVSFCGCCGAIRKNRLLLGVYITLLSLLMIVELAAGILTIFRKKQIKTGLSEKLLNNLQKQFGKSSVITLAWNAIQVSDLNINCFWSLGSTFCIFIRVKDPQAFVFLESKPASFREKCCGVYGPSDYNSSFWINSSHDEFPDKNKDKDKDKDKVKDISGGLSNFSKPFPFSCCVFKNKQPWNVKYCMDLKSGYYHESGCLKKLEQWLSQKINLIISAVIGIAALEIFGLVASICLWREAYNESADKQV